MEAEQLSSLAVTHLLQHTLRSFCIHENSQWVYAVFWRILPRNYPPPKWDTQGGVYERSRGNRRNWILVWEDGFCNFAATTAAVAAGGDSPGEDCLNSGDEYHNNTQHYQGLQPELFFKMSHEIYNYGEGLIGKVAADHSHKWIYKEPTNQEINFLSAWQNSADSHPRTWEAQFQSGIKTIALIAVREGVIQLGAVDKVMEDLSYIVLLRKKFSYIESIPGVLLPHPSSVSVSAAATYPLKIDGYGQPQDDPWTLLSNPPQYTDQYYENYNINQNMPMKITPSMSSLEALLSKLPSVVVPVTTVTSPPTSGGHQQQPYMSAGGGSSAMGIMEKVAKEEFDEEGMDVGETSSSISSYQQQQQPLFGYHNNLHPSDDTTMHNHGPY